MRVIFRADFQGRKGELETGFKFPNPPVEHIEVIRKADKWLARVGKIELAKLGTQPSYSAMQQRVEDAFEAQLSKWLLCDTDGKPLDLDSVDEDPNGNFTWRELTHVGVIGANAQGQTGPNYFNTVCGIEVHVSKIKSVRSKNPPSCQACRREWDKTKPEDRFK